MSQPEPIVVMACEVDGCGYYTSDIFQRVHMTDNPENWRAAPIQHRLVKVEVVPASRLEQVEKERDDLERWANDAENPLFDAGWTAAYKRGANKARQLQSDRDEALQRVERLEEALEDLLLAGARWASTPTPPADDLAALDARIREIDRPLDEAFDRAADRLAAIQSGNAPATTPAGDEGNDGGGGGSG